MKYLGFDMDRISDQERAAAAWRRAYATGERWNQLQSIRNGGNGGVMMPHGGVAAGGWNPYGMYDGSFPLPVPHFQCTMPSLPSSQLPSCPSLQMPALEVPVLHYSGLGMQPFQTLPLPHLHAPPLSNSLYIGMGAPPDAGSTVHSYAGAPMPWYPAPGSYRLQPGMWPGAFGIKSSGLSAPYQGMVKTERNLPVTVKLEAKTENDIFYEEESDWEEECEDIGIGDLDVDLDGDHLCEGMIVDGVCKCLGRSTSPGTVQTLPELDVENLDALEDDDCDVIVLSSGTNSPDCRSPPPGNAPDLLQSDGGVAIASQAQNFSSHADHEVASDQVLEHGSSASVPAGVNSQQALVEGADVSVNSDQSHVSDGHPAALSVESNKEIVAATRGRNGQACQRSAGAGPSRKRKDMSGNRTISSPCPQPCPLDEMISQGKLDCAIRLPKLEEQGVAVQDPHREVVVATGQTFEQLRVRVHAECQEQKLSIRRPDLKAASIMRQKGLWINFNNVVGPVNGVKVGDAFPFRIALCVLGLHRHIRAGIGYVPEKDSEYKMSYATSVVIGKAKVYRDDVDNGETVIYTGQGGLSTKKDDKGVVAVATDQKLVRGNLALSNSHTLQIPVRLMRGHSCASSPSGVMYTYDGMYMIESVSYEQGLDQRMVYKFRLQRTKDQAPLLPFVDYASDATPLQAVPNTTSSKHGLVEVEGTKLLLLKG